MDHKEKVLMVWPDAYAISYLNNWSVFAPSETRKLIGFANTEELAWKDACNNPEFN